MRIIEQKIFMFSKILEMKMNAREEDEMNKKRNISKLFQRFPSFSSSLRNTFPKFQNTWQNISFSKFHHRLLSFVRETISIYFVFIFSLLKKTWSKHLEKKAKFLLLCQRTRQRSEKNKIRDDYSHFVFSSLYSILFSQNNGVKKISIRSSRFFFVFFFLNIKNNSSFPNSTHQHFLVYLNVFQKSTRFQSLFQRRE